MDDSAHMSASTTSLNSSASSDRTWSMASLRPRVLQMALLVPLLLGAVQIALQVSDAHYVDSVAQRVVHRAGAVTPRERVIALRNYLRANISFDQAPFSDRPFLRASAGETLRLRRGFCGEVTRTF